MTRGKSKNEGMNSEYCQDYFSYCLAKCSLAECLRIKHRIQKSSTGKEFQHTEEEKELNGCHRVGALKGTYFE